MPLLRTTLLAAVLLGTCTSLVCGQIRPVDLKTFEPDGIAAVAFSPNSKLLTTAEVDGSVRLWDVAKQKELCSTKAHAGGTFAVAFAPDGRLVISAGADGLIRMWDSETLKERGQMRGHEKEVTCLAVAPDGKTLASGSMDKTVRLWDLASKQELRKFIAHDSGVHTLAFTTNGKALLSVGDVTTVIKDGNTFVITGPDKPRLWSPATGKQLRVYDVPGSSVAVSPDQRVLAALATLTEYNGNQLRSTMQFRLLDGFSGQALPKVKMGGSGMAFSSDGRLLALVSNQLVLWEVATGKVAYERPKVEGRLVAFSPSGKHLAIVIPSYGPPMPGGPPRKRLDFVELPPDHTERAQRAKGLDMKAAEQLWEDLLSTDAKKGCEAVWTLFTAPQVAVRLLKDRLKPAPGVEVRQLQKLLTALDSGRFAERNAASAALEKLDPLVAPALQDVLASPKTSAEMRKRLQSVLSRMKSWSPRTGESLRHVRAVQVLEWIGTPEAQALLAQLASDPETITQLGHDARLALQRLRAKAP